MKRTFFLLAISTIPTAYHAYSQVLLSYEPPFACATPQEKNFLFPTENFTEYYHLVVPNYQHVEMTQNAAQCITYDFGNRTFESVESVMAFTNETTHIDCTAQEWRFDNSEVQSTATTEWGNVCSRKQLNTFDTQSFMIGKLIGAFIFGAMSDAIGRFKTYFISLLLQFVFAVVVAVAPNIVVYSLARLAVGAACSGVYLCAYVLALEFIGPDNRTAPGLAYHLFGVIGLSLLAPIGYYVKDFRTISWILALPTLLFLPNYFFMDESVQWLLGKKRISDAEKIIVKAAKYNKKTLQTPIFTLTDDETADAKKTGCVEGFSGIGRVFTGNYPRLRKRFLALFVLWFINSGSFYGITLNIRNIGGNFYMNILLTAVVEIPAVFLIIFMVEKWEVGRRSILMAAYFLCGALNLMVAGIQWYAGSGEVWTILIRILALGGKFAISGAYAVLYLFTTEQFPTVAKNSGLGICSLCARLGGLLCPYVVNSGTIWEPLPLLIFGGVAVIAGSLMVMLPETHKKHLPTTLEEGEQFGTKNKKSDQVEKKLLS